MKIMLRNSLVPIVALSLFAPHTGASPAGSSPDTAKASFSQATAFLQAAAKKDRDLAKAKTFEEFKAGVYKEPFPGGKYIVNGDTTILNEKLLREFFEKHIVAEPETGYQGVELIVHQVGGIDAVWNSEAKKHITYCVSTEFDRTFGQPYYQKVVQDMATATGAWEAVADVDFVHVSSEDQSCDASNANVVFDVRPVDEGQYLARAFFPNEPRRARNVLIDKSSFDFQPDDKLQLTGVLRHELGHTLGFRHEHTRPEAGKCYEDDNWRPLSDYDPFSVMHYPQCNGLGDWSLTLTAQDKMGAACLYQPAPGFSLDPRACPDFQPEAKKGCLHKDTYHNQKVALRQEERYGPFPVFPGSLFTAVMSGEGDPDLYVGFDLPPKTDSYDCRPYLSGADERCRLDVPSSAANAYIMVRGYQAGDYTLSLEYHPPE
jgi:serine protease